MDHRVHPLGHVGMARGALMILHKMQVLVFVQLIAIGIRLKAIVVSKKISCLIIYLISSICKDC